MHIPRRSVDNNRVRSRVHLGLYGNPESATSGKELLQRLLGSNGRSVLQAKDLELRVGIDGTVELVGDAAYTASLGWDVFGADSVEITPDVGAVEASAFSPSLAPLHPWRERMVAIEGLSMVSGDISIGP